MRLKTNMRVAYAIYTPSCSTYRAREQRRYLFILIINNRSLLSRFLDVGLKLAWLPDFRVNLRTKLKLYMA